MRTDYYRYEIFRNQEGTTDQLQVFHLPKNTTDKY